MGPSHKFFNNDAANFVKFDLVKYKKSSSTKFKSFFNESFLPAAAGQWVTNSFVVLAEIDPAWRSKKTICLKINSFLELLNKFCLAILLALIKHSHTSSISSS